MTTSTDLLTSAVDAKTPVNLLSEPTNSGLVSTADSSHLAELTTPVITQAPTNALSSGLSPIFEFLQTGGPVVWILSLFSLFALTLIFIKCWQFAVLRAESVKDVKAALKLWHQHEPEQALARLDQKRPVSEVLAFAMQGVSQASYHPNSFKEEIERLAEEKIQALKAYLRPLEVVATLSPLLGLLGTVLGMIVAFQNMEAAGSQVDPSVLSGGIWQALLTTAVGLAVAIPVVAIHALFERKVERIVHLMNDTVTQVLTSPVGDKARHFNLVESHSSDEEQSCAA